MKNGNNQKDSLIEFLDSVVDSNMLSIQDKMKFLNDFIDITISICEEEKYNLSLVKAEIELIKINKAAGLFDECIRLAEHLSFLTNEESVKEFAVTIIIEAADASGNIELEGKMISELFDCKDILGLDKAWYYLTRFFTKTNANKSLEYIDRILAEVETSTDIGQKFKMYEQVVVGYFYLGSFEKAMKIMNHIKNNFEKYFKNNEIMRLHYQHKMAILMHNIDKNELVVNINLELKQAYEKNHDIYNYFLACVNLADGYMGIGNLAMAEEELEKVYIESKNSPWVHAKNIAAICYANALLTRGKISIALLYYEEGISISKELQFNWDYYYGKIWRALALAEVGDFSTIDNLYDLKNECELKSYKYLVNLAACFILISSWILKKKLGLEECYNLLNNISEKESPGIKAQAIASLLLTNDLPLEEDRKLLLEMINNCLECDGIKGKPQLISLVIENKKEIIQNNKLLSKIDSWIIKYVRPVIDDFLEVENYYLNGLKKRPLLKTCNLSTCKGMCCYDGVYLQEGDEEKILKFVQDNKEYFDFLPSEYFVDGNWRDLEKGRKTATRNCMEDEYINYPKHFEKTKCIFCFSNGLCSLQKLATELDLHPWKFKPKTCWMFPILSFQEGPKAPPIREEIDPHYIDETYPGYIKFLPCCKEADDGVSWSSMFKQEIIYQNYLEKSKNT